MIQTYIERYPDGIYELAKSISQTNGVMTAKDCIDTSALNATLKEQILSVNPNQLQAMRETMAEHRPTNNNSPEEPSNNNRIPSS